MSLLPTFLMGYSVVIFMERKGICRKKDFSFFLFALWIPLLGMIPLCLYLKETDKVVFGAFLSILPIVFGEDLRSYEIPKEVNEFLLFLACIHGMLLQRMFLRYIFEAIMIGFFLMALYLASKGRMLGGGDVKFIVISSLILGLEGVVFVLLWAGILGILSYVIKGREGKDETFFAFGPYMAAASYFYVLLKGFGIGFW